MYNPILVRLCQPATRLIDEVGRTRDGRRSQAGQQRCAVLALQVLHDQVGRLVGCATAIDDRDQVRVLEFPSHPRLVFEAAHEFAIGGEFWTNELHGESACQGDMPRFVDVAHSSSPQNSNDGVPVGNRGAHAGIILLETDRIRRVETSTRRTRRGLAR
jgi:hypothetical protein